MTLDEAIEENERGTRQNRSTKNQRLREALRIGIEAMKRLQNYRKKKYYYARSLLPGETEE